MRVVAGEWLGAALVFLASCSSLPQRPLIPVPPESLGGSWTRTGVMTPGLEGVPESLRGLKPAQWVKTGYRQAGRAVQVQIYGMPTEASAFEARQKWRNEGLSTAFHKGNLFVVCSTESMAMAGLLEFSGLVENEWLRGGR